MMAGYELHIPPERQGRNRVTGRFMKGCEPHNKDKRMRYKSESTRMRSVRNLTLGHGSWHKTGAGTNRKSVVAIRDGKLCGVFDSQKHAADIIGVSQSLVSRICRKVKGKHTAKGYGLFFENDDSWFELIK